MRCKYCGANITDNSKFCAICGKAVQKEDDNFENTNPTNEPDSFEERIRQIRENKTYKIISILGGIVVCSFFSSICGVFVGFIAGALFAMMLPFLINKLLK